ncbi:uncharacterized protein LOC123305587 [Chrysoperla carnea]|uniref:uncharacterized protein LOC123305587 n=1 Tax=Chrysoperla carnea TaxID=189513 RepID=UPI001D07A637|nr:uncharacterized protein LOC123305587 [Chrysoperla carnea]
MVYIHMMVAFVTSIFSKTTLLCCRFSWIFIACLTLTTDECWCLRDVQLVVLPPAVERGGSVALLCRYDLENAPLYSVNWYRGTYEFYRYSPSEIPTIKLFKLNGIHVDDTLSNSTQVVLSDVSFSLSGNFSCEVTTDSPFFSAQTASAELTVIELPETPPILMVERDHYSLGDILRANCTSPPSRPPAGITFHINGMMVGVESIDRYGADNLLSSGHTTNTFNGIGGSQLNPYYNNDGSTNLWNPSINRSTSASPNTLQVTCTAHIAPGDYHRSTNVQIPVRLGEPVHERVMSPSSGSTRTRIDKTHILLFNLFSILITKLNW